MSPPLTARRAARPRPATAPAAPAGGTTPTVIEARALRRTFGDVVALAGADLTVRAGELVGLLGPNGAGKSTLLNLVSGLRRPTSGTVRLFGADPRGPGSRLRLGTTPQGTGLPPTLRVGEVVDFVAGHYPDAVPTGELLDRFGLSALARKQTGGLSGGQQRRLAVALAFVGRPHLVLLDEPTTGLDVGARQELWSAIREYHADGGTVLLTSHYLEEVQALAERVVVIDGGHVLADDSLDAVLDRVALHRVVVTTPDDAVDHLPGIVRAERVGERRELYTADADAFVRDLVRSGVAFRDLEVRGASLEEAFEQMVAAGPPRTEENR
ncbi:ABC transporter ATP-binding protein [Georgenia faecalis]|uniref:ABC transporter ATP-binding protein n=1 Tax=Georgenia faecalis TaxID=2483799 RepID=A0ABV9DBT0_9MICO|nr:ABC transporter ATP-binding protein [Georgenia faecalis]